MHPSRHNHCTEIQKLGYRKIKRINCGRFPIMTTKKKTSYGSKASFTSTFRKQAARVEGYYILSIYILHSLQKN